tara:strand:+ start:366 stop:968 length:603 start_codon:yes stop_codon:yes gene_type:complete
MNNTITSNNSNNSNNLNNLCYNQIKSNQIQNNNVPQGLELKSDFTDNLIRQELLPSYQNMPNHDFGMTYNVYHNPESIKYMSRKTHQHNRQFPYPCQKFNFKPFRPQRRTINDETEIEPFSRAIQDAKVKFQAHLHDKISDIMMRVDDDIERMDSYENGNPNYEIENHTLPKKYSPQMRKILNQDSTENINYDAFLILKQ